MIADSVVRNKLSIVFDMIFTKWALSNIIASCSHNKWFRRKTRYLFFTSMRKAHGYMLHDALPMRWTSEAWLIASSNGEICALPKINTTNFLGLYFLEQKRNKQINEQINKQIMPSKWSVEKWIMWKPLSKISQKCCGDIHQNNKLTFLHIKSLHETNIF